GAALRSPALPRLRGGRSGGRAVSLAKERVAMKGAWPSTVILVLTRGANARAQAPGQGPGPGPGPGPGQDPLAPHVFPPELVMRHAPEIGLDEKQRAAIKEVVVKMQARFLDVQWDLQAESEKMARLLQASPVDETAVLAQADKVMTLER